MAASLHERIAVARRQLEQAGLTGQDARFDAEVLARHVLGWDRAQIVSRGREQPPADFETAYRQSIERRMQREPVALIVGRREFWGLDFEVTPHTLIPRPETELIVESSLEILRGAPHARVLDVGTGTGCLAVSIAHDAPGCRVVATDISLEALAVARRNADRHGVAARVRFAQANLLDGIGGVADLIVGNLPYVPDASLPGLSPDVARYEPHTALFGGADGLALIRRLLATAPERLAPGGRLIIEFGFGQESEVRDLAERTGWHVDGVRADLQGLPRAAVLRR